MNRYGKRIDLNSSFDKNSYYRLPINTIVGFEFAPIVEAWFDMWMELKNEWGDDFNKNYLSYKILDNGKVEPVYSIFDLNIYKKFIKQRVAIIDTFIKADRISSMPLS